MAFWDPIDLYPFGYWVNWICCDEESMEDKLQVYLKAEVQLACKFTSKIPVSSVSKVDFY